jgi:hypothetical protein
MKKIIKVILITAMLLPVSPVIAADTPPVIAIIDTGTNAELFPGSIVTEACIVSSYTCPNGKSNMEGAGASNLPATKNKDLNHGTQLISIMLRVNPSAKIIPIRIVPVNRNGLPGLYSLADVKAALDWVIANRVKYNIAVVSLAQGRVFANCKVPDGMADQIAVLKRVEVPLIVAVGNDGNHTAVNSPSCLTDSVAIGATDNPWPGVQPITYDEKAAPYIARYSNGAQGQTDFFLNARWNVKQLDGSTKFTVGTSNATAAMAGYWLLNRKATFDETYASILAVTTDAKNEFISGKYIFIPTA